ncbi:MAG: dihydrolipoamide acetyltransferase family protein [Gammaproteobacteria bacterium]
MPEFLMPSLGADMTQGTLVEWAVKPGDRVHRGDVVAVVETSKGAIDVEIFSDGIIDQLLVPEGTTVPVGEPLALVRSDGRPEPEAPAAPAEAPVRPVTREPAPEAPAEPAVPVEPSTPAPAAEARGEAAARVRASPAARRRAEELDVDIGKLQGTGPGGAVVIADVEQASGPGPAEEETPNPMGEKPRALTEAPGDIREIIAAAMTRSKREIPHYYLSNWVDLAPANGWLADWNDSHPVEERLIPGVLMIRAVALALERFHEFNGFFRDGKFQPGDGIHVGAAISLRRGGLVAPGLRDANKRSLVELMTAFRGLVARARAGRLKASEMAGGTITVSSLGEQGVEEVYPVIYSPQVAIVGFGTPSERPWVVEGRVEPRWLVRVSLAADHRVSDGHRGALFLEAVTHLLQEPDSL